MISASGILDHPPSRVMTAVDDGALEIVIDPTPGYRIIR